MEQRLDTVIHQRCLALCQQLELNRQLLRTCSDALASSGPGKAASPASPSAALKQQHQEEQAQAALRRLTSAPGGKGEVAAGQHRAYLDLQAEARALHTIIREYEETLEEVMAKFRLQNEGMLTAQKAAQVAHQRELDAERATAHELFTLNTQLEREVGRLRAGEARHAEEVGLLTTRLQLLEADMITLRATLASRAPPDAKPGVASALPPT